MQTLSCNAQTAVQDLVRENIALNQGLISGSGGAAAAQAFVWGETEVTELAPEWRTPDLIVAADVVYRRELFQPLLQALQSLGKASKCQGLHCR